MACASIGFGYGERLISLRFFGVGTVSQSSSQFNELIAIVGLPRSGTTLAASVFDAHPLTVTCYEPWNQVAGVEMTPELSPQDLVERFDLKVSPDANIFVLKETTVDFRAIQWLTKFLHQNATTHRIKIVWSLRNYRHSYLSFVEGAREWWGHDGMTPGAEGYNKWVERACSATAALLALYQKYPGAVFAYEALATDPSKV